jgi:cell division protein ZapA
MAQVTVRINGYSYVLGCEDGQETHLAAMAEQVEARIDSIKAMGGQSGEAKLLVLASLLMADELHDLKAANAPPRHAASEPALNDAAFDPIYAARLARLASRAETIAADLEAP